jgi:hypothetical protein
MIAKCFLDWIFGVASVIVVCVNQKKIFKCHHQKNYFKMLVKASFGGKFHDLKYFEVVFF